MATCGGGADIKGCIRKQTITENVQSDPLRRVSFGRNPKTDSGIQNVIQTFSFFFIFGQRFSREITRPSPRAGFSSCFPSKTAILAS